MATPNQIAALISAWFESTPNGLFGALTGVGTNRVHKDPAVVEWLDTAIAICLAESGGNPDARNSKSSASGLWQIMVSVHGEKIREAASIVGAKTGEPLAVISDPMIAVMDPRVNTAVAGRIYHESGNKWTAWSAYNSGAYKKYKGKGSAAFDWLNNEKNIARYVESLKIPRKPNETEEAWYKRVFETATALSPLRALNGLDDDNPLKDPLERGLDIVTPDGIANKVLGFAKEAGITIGVFLIALVALILGVAFIVSSSGVGKAVVKKSPIGAAVKAVS